MCSFYNLKTNHQQIFNWSGVASDQDWPEAVAVKQFGHRWLLAQGSW